MDAGDLQQLERQAREYLLGQLQSRTPDVLEFAERFAESPLEGEGPVAVFQFSLPVATAPASDANQECNRYDPLHYVVVGETQPNYHPAYGLSASDIYSLHIGTRFMMEVGLEKRPLEQEPAEAREAFRQLLQDTNPQARIADESVVVLFRCQDQWLAVYRVSLNERPIYVVAGDLTPGFYEMTQYPPQVALRLHLGQLIRMEAREQERAERVSRR